MLVVALALSSCGGSPGDARALSEAGCRAIVKRSRLAARRVAGPPDRAGVAPVVFRAAEAGESIQREFADVRPPARIAPVHPDLVRLGGQQLTLIRTALARLRIGAASEAVAAVEARSRRLLECSDELAGELGLAECVNEPAGA